MENKYFTPDIEDIRVGYECEVAYLHEDNWTYVKCRHQEETKDFILAVFDYNRRVRVPYLTKEQIEAEGWKAKEDKTYYISSDHGGYILKHVGKQIEIIDLFDANYIYRGECKDINTFRYICKLLKIN